MKATNERRNRPTTAPPDQVAPDPARLSPSQDWSEREHQADAATLDAQRLLDKTGSPELAKAQVDRVAQSAAEVGGRDAFARTLGLNSYEELAREAAPVRRRDGQVWLVAQLPDQQWIAWDEADPQANQRFESRAAAEQAAAGASQE